MDMRGVFREREGHGRVRDTIDDGFSEDVVQDGVPEDAGEEGKGERRKFRKGGEGGRGWGGLGWGRAHDMSGDGIAEEEVECYVGVVLL